MTRQCAEIKDGHFDVSAVVGHHAMLAVLLFKIENSILCVFMRIASIRQFY